MKAVIYASARRHGIEDAEIRAVPGAQLVRLVGDLDGGPLTEVVADQVDGDELHVFHAMLLTSAVAREVFEVTGEQIDLSSGVSRRQRLKREE
ncbi:hypothetical protein [Dietzia sp. UCD-THP]|uniref:hypothetical protein n=1 Tax=Dietzia sp. UCD-THP TaxID=1292020 RepID=UPI00126908C2|nr:hypothetical protein [Dietzia sp. UCD-THP]